MSEAPPAKAAPKRKRNSAPAEPQKASVQLSLLCPGPCYPLRAFLSPGDVLLASAFQPGETLSTSSSACFCREHLPTSAVC